MFATTIYPRPSAPSSTTRTLSYDGWLLLVAGTLIVIGLLMVASSSMVISDRQYHTPLHFLLRQSIYAGVGIGCAFIVMRLPIRLWEKISGYLLLLSLILLVVVLIPGIGHEVNGSMRWIAIGPIGMQVSELAKYGVVVYMAGYLVRREEEIRTRAQGFIKPMMILTVFACLLLLEPDFGAIAVILITTLGMMFLAGVRLWQFVALLLLVGAVMCGVAVSSPYRLVRLTAFLHPWANPFDSGYQLTQSLIAFGRGGIFGVGLGNSIQKLFYLLEAHIDFLFAVLAEEFGLVGSLIVLGLFTVLVCRGLYIGRAAQRTGRPFAAYLAYGLSLWVGLQAMINMGVNVGVLPTKGLTLPLMSYGGSSLLINCLIIAVLLRISYETHKVAR